MRLWPAGPWRVRRDAEDTATVGIWGFRCGLGMLCLGLICRLHLYWLSFPIWRDEASLALNLVQRDFRGLLRELDNFQIAPLLFLWIEKAVCTYLGSSVWLLRLVPILAGVAGLVLFWHLARRCLTPLPAALAVGFLAVAHSPIHLAGMIKPYSLDLFAATFLLTLAVHYLQNPQRTSTLVALALVVPLAVAASYPVIFIAGAVSLVLLPVVRAQGNSAGRYAFVAFNLLCAAAFVAHLRFVGHAGHDPTLPDVQSYMSWFWQGGFMPRQPFAAMRWLVRCHTGHMLSYPLAFNGGGLLGLFLALVGARALYQQRRLDLLGLCVLPFALNLVAAMLHRYPYGGGDQRLEQHLVPGLCLLLGSGVAQLLRWLPRGQTVVFASLIAVFVLLALAAAIGDTLQPYHNAEASWAQEVARHLGRELRPGDRILLPQSPRFTLVCLRWQLLPLAGQVCYWDDIDWPQLQQSAGRVWLVDQRVELSGPLQEPTYRDLARLIPVLSQEPWHATQHVRFVGREPTSCQEQVYCYCCDLQVLERSIVQAHHTGKKTVRSVERPRSPSG